MFSRAVLPLILAVMALQAAAQPMQRVNLLQPDAQCNDGTSSGFYIRPSHSDSPYWVVHMQGGWWCWDQTSCEQRAKNSPDLVSSTPWPATLSIGGMFKQNTTKGTLFEDANMVYLKYCSSDAYVGSGSTVEWSGKIWQFNGRNIIRQTLATLISDWGLKNGSTVIYSGCSAGGQGVINNLDFVSEFITSQLGESQVVGIADAGWMMDVKPLRTNIVSVADEFKAAIGSWAPELNSDCIAANAMQYDTFQVPYQCCMPPFNRTGELAWVTQERATFQNTLSASPTSVFSPACWSHCITEDSNSWNSIMVNGVLLPQLLQKWIAKDRAHSKVHYIDRCEGFNCSKGCPTPKSI